MTTFFISVLVTRLSSQRGISGSEGRRSPCGIAAISWAQARRHHQALEQRIAGQAVGAVQPGAGGFADGIQSGRSVRPAIVGHNAATGVVRGRHHRDRLLGDVDAQFQRSARRMVGKCSLQELRDSGGEMSRLTQSRPRFFISKSMARATTSRGASSPRASYIGHEAGAGGGAGSRRQLEQPAFAAHRFGDQEGLGMRVVEAGRVELDEFHVRRRGSRRARPAAMPSPVAVSGLVV